MFAIASTQLEFLKINNTNSFTLFTSDYKVPIKLFKNSNEQMQPEENGLLCCHLPKNTAALESSHRLQYEQSLRQQGSRPIPDATCNYSRGDPASARSQDV